MTPWTKVSYVLQMNQFIDASTKKEIKNNGYSRIPICDGNNRDVVIGFLLVKSLLGLDTTKPKTIAQLYREGLIQVKIPLYIPREATLGSMVKAFQRGQSHMAIVLDTEQSASKLRDYAEDYHKKMSNHSL